MESEALTHLHALFNFSYTKEAIYSQFLITLRFHGPIQINDQPK